ncbi:DUF2892 domain-containing protein [Variovorax humicola]|uniref:DUF2892 domain-containing protein n=1 Tax=Variovorax humicola TaxID=1769758 RepID=A0ABU8W9J2_9BURK
MPFLSINVGPVDRALRIGLGILLIVLAATGVVGLWGYLGVVAVLTGVVGNCPLYSLFNLDTQPRHKR